MGTTMAHIATPTFLTALRKLYPSPSTCVHDNPWYVVAATAFTASNRPKALPVILQHVLDDLDSHGDRMVAARKIRDGVFKSGLICGFPKVINALASLHDATPAELQDEETLRRPASMQELGYAGQAYFDATYGHTATSTQSLLSAIYPDLGFWVTQFAYGYAYAYTGATSAKETSFAMISALIAIHTPRQLAWHLQGALRNGATRDEVRAVREMAMRISKASGVVGWVDENVPNID